MEMRKKRKKTRMMWWFAMSSRVGRMNSWRLSTVMRDRRPVEALPRAASAIFSASFQAPG